MVVGVAAVRRGAIAAGVGLTWSSWLWWSGVFGGLVIGLSFRCWGGEGACREEGDNGEDLGVLHDVYCCGGCDCVDGRSVDLSVWKVA